MAIESLSMKLFNLSSAVAKKFDACSIWSPTSLNLKSVLEFGRSSPVSKSFEFLRHELPIRIANIMQEILLLPEPLLQVVSVKQIANIYARSFEELSFYEDIHQPSSSVISDFHDCLCTVRDRHISVVEMMSTGICSMLSSNQMSPAEDAQLHYFLNRFYLSRIGVRFLISQQVLTYGTRLDKNASFVGYIDPNCNPLNVACDAYVNAYRVSKAVYGVAPSCDILVRNTLTEDARAGNELHKVNAVDHPDVHRSRHGYPQLTITDRPMDRIFFVYVPSHLFHILFELFKNAMRATVEFHKDVTGSLPHMQCLIVNAKEDITISITDEGGGLPLPELYRAFKYTYTTAEKPMRGALRLAPDIVESSVAAGKVDGKFRSPILAGYGHGLPLSRLYARYLCGDLNLISIEGVGTKASVYLKRLPEESSELLPIFNRTSARTYQYSESPGLDWISNGG